MLVLLAAASTPGCVTRRLFVVSDPPGARVLLDDVIVGTTPYQKDIIGYGTYHLELDLAGHQPWRGEIVLDQPWWQYFPFDVVTDLLWPFEIKDERRFEFVLLPQAAPTGTWEEAREVYQRMRERLGRAAGREGATGGGGEP